LRLELDNPETRLEYVHLKRRTVEMDYWLFGTLFSCQGARSAQTSLGSAHNPLEMWFALPTHVGRHRPGGWPPGHGTV